jgi:hypothetical protein
MNAEDNLKGRQQDFIRKLHLVGFGLMKDGTDWYAVYDLDSTAAVGLLTLCPGVAGNVGLTTREVEESDAGTLLLRELGYDD